MDHINNHSDCVGLFLRLRRKQQTRSESPTTSPSGHQLPPNTPTESQPRPDHTKVIDPILMNLAEEGMPDDYYEVPHVSFVTKRHVEAMYRFLKQHWSSYKPC